MLALLPAMDDYCQPQVVMPRAAPSSVRTNELGIAGATVFALAAKQDLFVEGDPADFVYEVLEGTVTGYRILADGERHVTSFYFPGDLLGYCCASFYNMSVQAVGAAKVRRIPRMAMERLLEAKPDLTRRLLRMATEELSATRDHLLCIAAKSAEAKIASFLLALLRRNRDAGVDNGEIVLAMTRHDIADYLGLTVETVSRSLTKLKTAGVIALPRATRVQVRDRAALQAMANA
jgi:CRP/FNR family transcriptional regulator